ncbi:50S ribosomal protein L6 [Candidatus Mesenet endosymbiont of Agriotes lineatus]|uniref:50S ribosomal protein L6 n=1 Tax=Candidatus Mesenet endosymbiont of Agriotes lineatus TaxID=3077948 RepID=UPI0030CD9B9D
MSRVNLVPVTIPDSVELKCYGNKLLFQNSIGRREFILNSSILYKYDGNKLLLSIDKNNFNKKINALLGTYISNINNFIYGITKGFSLCLEINGIGYKAGYNGKYLTLSLGFSHDIIYRISEHVKCECIKQDIVITGIDKQKVHMLASDLCKIRKFNPYKGKGIVLKGKIMLRKETSKKK